jgi:hypothetical protein
MVIRNHDMKLSATELDQLISYVYDREQVGWYYGNKAQFEKRHENIKRELELLQVLYGKPN